jgi:hypothetical protein
MAFDDWLNGTYSFYGVCHNEFKLNDQVWEAIEDPDDGYRSYLGSIEKKDSNGIFFPDPLAQVHLTHEDNGNRDVYRLTDMNDGHIWLEFGTDDTDDYYPYFVFEYHPKEAQQEEVPQVEERLGQAVDELFGQPVAAVEGPTVQVVLPEGGRTPLIPWADLQRDGVDLATASDAQVLRLIANYLDRDIGVFGSYQVTRPDVGRIVAMPKPAYGFAKQVHTLHVMDGTGDQAYEYDPQVKTEVAPVAMVFARFAAAGYLGFAIDENDRSRRITEFDETAPKIVMTPRIMGG